MRSYEFEEMGFERVDGTGRRWEHELNNGIQEQIEKAKSILCSIHPPEDIFIQITGDRGRGYCVNIYVPKSLDSNTSSQD